MNVKIYQVDSFTKNIFSGNPAGVVPEADSLSDKQMQQIAGELNNSETAFILSPEDDTHEVWLRFFTPTTEVPSCGHATIAAHYIRALLKDLPTTRVIQKIGTGILPVDIERNGGDYKIWMTQGEPEFSENFSGISLKIILSALNLDEQDVLEEAPIQFVSTGHGKVIVCIKNRNKLNTLKPDLTRLSEISEVTGYRGFFVFTFDSEESKILTHGRMFAPVIGINEDPVTGNANGPLGAYLVKNRLVDFSEGIFSFTAAQGEAMGRPGYVDVEVTVKNNQPRKVRIGGYAVKVFESSINI